MAYEAPKISVVGSFASTTLGNPNERVVFDGFNWFLPDFSGPNGSK
ncbi:lasso RiPP family leader peptide-containing protein [Microbacterium horticulturae]|uniref:Lasso RiPP family leader peptide-containing protein n=1 Tax=Microbacterium horticulturae TaxID=3028316 RepID=A0ABY8C3G1_9MICO|nr:lasso RiPP family leader peptide-containing protein [Microbacterium sp. KACC 23027]WEG09168.1 lasso RiPP family leader peptide-containing protein [Microbacterium sp. KACC 23027]